MSIYGERTHFLTFSLYLHVEMFLMATFSGYISHLHLLVNIRIIISYNSTVLKNVNLAKAVNTTNRKYWQSESQSWNDNPWPGKYSSNVNCKRHGTAITKWSCNLYEVSDCMFPSVNSYRKKSALTIERKQCCCSLSNYFWTRGNYCQLPKRGISFPVVLN